MISQRINMEHKQDVHSNPFTRQGNCIEYIDLFILQTPDVEAALGCCYNGTITAVLSHPIIDPRP
jgi:hypothetical protein